MRAPGPLVASGRDCDIYEYGDGLVLRRSRAGHSMAMEARVMEYARGHGFPVPAVHDISDDGTDLVMQRIGGLSMVEDLGRRPWTLKRHGKVLADLHKRLHGIPAPDWMEEAPVGSGAQLVHFDLHPLNVMLAPTGPVVIDWPNARRGDGCADVAVSWVLIAVGAIPGGRIKAAAMGLGRSVLVNSMLGEFDMDAVRATVPAVVRWKMTDDHMSATERDAMQALAAKVAPHPDGR